MEATLPSNAHLAGIPSVDLGDFLSGDAARKAAFVQELGYAFEQVGFVALRGHLLEEENEKELYKLVQDFFALPIEVKKSYEIEELAGQRGYTSFGREQGKGAPAADLKEFWHFGQEPEGEEMDPAFYPPNMIVKELPGFHEAGMKAFRALEATGREVLRAIALYLNLEENYFDPRIHNGNSILRPIHYSPITTEPDQAVRAAAHEDINLITLLMGASADGLEVMNKKGEYVPVTALPEQLVVNVGDMLQRLTNNQLRSTTHRVVNPAPELWGTSRYSIPFFLHARAEVDLSALPQCIDVLHPLAYPSITAGEYLNERLREIGLKK